HVGISVSLIFVVSGDVLSATFLDPVVKVVSGPVELFWKSGRHRLALRYVYLPGSYITTGCEPLAATGPVAARGSPHLIGYKSATVKFFAFNCHLWVSEF